MTEQSMSPANYSLAAIVAEQLCLEAAAPGRSASTRIDDDTLVTNNHDDARMDLARPVYCLAGIPVDAVDMVAILRNVDAATADRKAFLISTPNLNFITLSQADRNFRESLLDSDLCPADGMPIVWIARLLGVPIRQRVSGSDIFEALKARTGRQLNVCLFGGESRAAAAAARALNDEEAGLRCVGVVDPGFVPLDKMNGDELIATVNSSGADILVAALGANKGQLWLHCNHERINIPVRAHLGAVINFQAGTVKRAPSVLGAWGLEWLWRIKEEPYLWRRYFRDGRILVHLMLAQILPLAAFSRWNRFKSRRQPQELEVQIVEQPDEIIISFSGEATERYFTKALISVQAALARNTKFIGIDLGRARVIDARIQGLLLMLRKQMKRRGGRLRIISAAPSIKRTLYLNNLDFLFAERG